MNSGICEGPGIGELGIGTGVPLRGAQPVLRDPETTRMAQHRLNVLKQFEGLLSEGLCALDAARSLGHARSTVWRWQRAWEQGGFEALLDHRVECGRPPAYQPTEGELACVREIYSRLNSREVHGRGSGSSRVMAYRMAAKGTDDRISAEFRHVVLDRRSKRVPHTWMRLLDLPAAVLDQVRDPDGTFTRHISTPRSMTYIAADGEERPVAAGTIFESDDGTVNFPCTVPWPFGGDPCSDKFGVKVGRFQLLPVVDVRTLFCPTFHFVVRAKSSYRGEDIVALFGEVFCETHVPEVVRLERGTWESQVVRDAMKLASVRVVNAWEPGQKAAVEGFFNRLWTPLSLVPGDVGRQRGEHKEATALLLACQEARRDPRDHFLPVDDAVRRLSAAIEFVNGEPVESQRWGTWMPREMWEAQLRPRTLDPACRIYFSREQRIWTVRKSMVGGPVPGPLVRFPVYFQCAELWEFGGCKVKTFFDPYADPILGTLVLQEAWPGYRAGTVIARDVPALDMPPQVILAEDGWLDEEHGRSLAIRKAIGKAVRTEKWHWLGGHSREARDGLGGLARHDGLEAGSGRDLRAPANPRLASRTNRAGSPAASRRTLARDAEEDPRLAEILREME